MVSRGERNNNPGNLEASSWTRSQPGYIGSDGRFAVFDTMANGIAAQGRLLSSYIRRGFDTVSEIINRYGNDPGPQDDANVRNYITYTARRLGVSPTDTLSIDQGPALAQAMREFETGNQRSGTVNIGSVSEFNQWAEAALNGGVQGAASVLDPFGVNSWLLGINNPNSVSGLLGRLFTPNLWSRATAIFIGIVLITVALVAFIISNRTEIVSNG